MAVTSAHIGSGTVLEIDETAGGAGTTWTAVAEVLSGSINNSGDIVDVTALDQSQLGQFVMGSRGATVSFTANFLPDSHNLTAGPLLLTMAEDARTFSFKITHNDAASSAVTGSGFIRDFTMSCSGHDNVVELACTIRAQPTATYANGLTYGYS